MLGWVNGEMEELGHHTFIKLPSTSSPTKSKDGLATLVFGILSIFFNMTAVWSYSCTWYSHTGVKLGFVMCRGSVVDFEGYVYKA